MICFAHRYTSPAYLPALPVSSAGARGRRTLRRALLVLIVVGLAAIVAFLPYAGRYLASEDPLERADVIVVLAGQRAERWLEAVDLRKEGWAPTIVLSPGRIEPAEEELRVRGITFPATFELIRGAIRQLGVPEDAVIVMPGSVDNTAHEAAAARRMAIEAGWRRLLVVTSKYHARRTGFAFRREFHGTPIAISVRTSRYDRSTPERWWRNRADIRWVSSELQKLLAYRLGLGE
jgi:uncharacterized SAM-binding protein YcdF (DUF218 family)